MADTEAPLEPASGLSPAASPLWRRRPGTSPGIIDGAAARRIYARTAGWAIQRIAHAGELAARYASADQGGAAAQLLLARVPVSSWDQASLEEDAATALGVTGAGQDEPRRGSSSNAGDATLAAPPAAASGLAMRLQRRTAGSGMIKVEPEHGVDHGAVSLRTGLHERLAARARSPAPPTPAAIQVARPVDVPNLGKDVGRGHSIMGRGARAADRASRKALGNPAPARAASELTAGDTVVAHAPAGSPIRTSTANLTASVRDVAGMTLPVMRPDSGGPSEASAPWSGGDASTSVDAISSSPINALASATPESRALARTSELAAPVSSHDAAGDALPLARTDSVTPSEASVSANRSGAPMLARKISDSQTGALADAAPEPGAVARTSEPAAAASPHDGAGTSLPLAHPNAGGSSDAILSIGRSHPSTLARKISRRETDEAVPVTPASLVREVVPVASTRDGVETALRLARVTASDAQPPSPDVFPRTGADSSLSQSDPDPGPPSAAATAHAALPVIMPAAGAAPSMLSVVHQVSGSPLTLARTTDVGNARGAASARDAAPAVHGSARVGATTARTAEISVAAAPEVPALVWRSAEHGGTRGRPAWSADPGGTGVLMRAGANDIAAGSVAAPGSPASVPAPPTDVARRAASAPDVNRLAEQVTRLIMRRLEIECERRGGKRWT